MLSVANYAINMIVIDSENFSSHQEQLRVLIYKYPRAAFDS